MKKYFLSAFVIVSFVFYAFTRRVQGNEIVVINRAILGTPTDTPHPIAPLVIGQYKDGIYTGSIADAFFGNVQVKTTVQGGRITDVLFLRYPNDRDTSRQISAFAMPRLRQEAVTAQNANVNIISGATQTSKAFRVSLASALTQAKN